MSLYLTVPISSPCLWAGFSCSEGVSPQRPCAACLVGTVSRPCLVWRDNRQGCHCPPDCPSQGHPFVVSWMQLVRGMSEDRGCWWLPACVTPLHLHPVGRLGNRLGAAAGQIMMLMLPPLLCGSVLRRAATACPTSMPARETVVVFNRSVVCSIFC